MSVTETRPTGSTAAGARGRPETRPLGVDGDGRRLPSLRDRVAPRLPRASAAWWVAYVAVTVLGGLLRFWHLGRPRAFVFDETYYAKDAWSLLHYGAEHNYANGADATILAGDPLGAWAPGGSFVVHPPVGKWMIALGEAVFGMNPVGWRMATAVCGTLAVLVLGRLVRRLTRSDLLGVLAALLLAVDGLAVVEARTAILDSLLMFWLLLATAALLLDRDRTRARLVARVLADTGALRHGGPSAGWRPWRLVAGLCFGLACATKWNGVFLLAVSGVMVVLWDGGARRAVGVRRPWWGMLRRDAAPAFLSLVGVSAVVYTASWAGWFAGSSGYDRQWGQTNPPSGAGAAVPTVLRSWWHYHAEMLNFNTHLTTPHTYQSNPLTWLLMARPVAFYYEGKLPGDGCADNCVQAVHALGTPALWWGGCVAVLVSVWLWAATRDWRAGLAVAGVVGTWVPWLFFAQRTIFSFYAIVTLPFLIVAVVLVIGTVLSRARARGGAWLPVVAALCGIYVVLVVADSGFLYPVLTAEKIPYEAWRSRMWFSRWI